MKTKNYGFQLSDHTEGRVATFTLLCSIIKFCSTDIYPYWAQEEVPSVSQARVAVLADTYAL